MADHTQPMHQLDLSFGSSAFGLTIGYIFSWLGTNSASGSFISSVSSMLGIVSIIVVIIGNLPKAIKSIQSFMVWVKNKKKRRLIKKNNNHGDTTGNNISE